MIGITISGPLMESGKMWTKPMVTRDELFNIRQMERIGNFAVARIMVRAKAGIGSDGQKMPPLKGKARAIKNAEGKTVRYMTFYANQKKRRGLNPFRDLVGFGKDGHMLDNLTVRQVTPNSVKIALTSRKARIKGLANEKLHPWLGFAPSDKDEIVKFAGGIFKSEVSGATRNAPDIIRRFRGPKRLSA
jgi:hypothetical protein